MNIFQLLCFVTLAGTATFSEASDKLYISQSSFSNNIQTMEKELEVDLVVRQRGTVTFTDAGHAFLSHARKIVDEYSNVNKLLREYKQSSGERVLLYTDRLSSYGYNDLITRFKNKHPEIQIEIIELVDENLDEMVKKSSDFVGITFSSKKKAGFGTKCHTLVTDRLAAFVTKAHCFSKKRSIKLSDLSNEPFQIISNRQSDFLNEFTLGQFHKAGVAPNVVSLDLWYSTLRETIRDLGVPAILPEKVARIFCQEDMKVTPTDADKFFINVVIPEACKNSAALRFFEFASES
ncbi:MAG: LysR family transcriptional regulator [Oscillospiraceae bacterium]|nr:LysR family transcriptional regulator [Oscillospiraceae bacterium]